MSKGAVIWLAREVGLAMQAPIGEASFWGETMLSFLKVE